MKQKDNPHLAALKRDYDSSDTPLWNDPMTVDTLDKIVAEVRMRRLTKEDFYSFVRDNLGQGHFAWGCEMYVRGKL